MENKDFWVGITFSIFFLIGFDIMVLVPPIKRGYDIAGGIALATSMIYLIYINKRLNENGM